MYNIKELLNVTKNGMTEDEWNSSFEYFSTLKQKAVLTKNFILSEILEIYKDFIDSNNWYIDFQKSDICVLYENETIPMNHNAGESFF